MKTARIPMYILAHFLGIWMPSTVVAQGYAAIRSSVVVSNLRSISFALSWITPLPIRPQVALYLHAHWEPVSDVRGDVRSTTHLFSVPCNLLVRSCHSSLQPATRYAVRVINGSTVSVVHVRTAGPLSPGPPLASIGGHVVAANHKPLKDALVYVVVRRGQEAAVPLATLTIKNGGWLVTLANAVTSSGTAFALQRGDMVSIEARTGRASGKTSLALQSLDQATLIKQPLVVR
jgi:hypothetical protein